MNKYLLKIASTRLKREIIEHRENYPEDRLKELNSKGVLKSEGQYAEGLAKRYYERDHADNFILDKSGRKIKRQFTNIDIPSLQSSSKHYDIAGNPITPEATIYRELSNDAPINVLQGNDRGMILSKSIKTSHRRGSEPSYRNPVNLIYDRVRTFIDPSAKTPELNRAQKGIFSTLAKNHELYETQYIQKQVARKHPILNSPNLQADTYNHSLQSRFGKNSIQVKALPLQAIHNDDGLPVGNHASPVVLARESNDLRHLPYPSSRKVLQGTRDYSTEADMLEGLTGKRYGRDRMNSKDMAKLDKVDATWNTGTSHRLKTMPKPAPTPVPALATKPSLLNRAKGLLSMFRKKTP